MSVYLSDECDIFNTNDQLSCPIRHRKIKFRILFYGPKITCELYVWVKKFRILYFLRFFFK